MKPSEKSEEMEQSLTDMFGFDRRDFIKNDTCAMCEGEAQEFRNEISRKEFSISGLCQKCQDDIFGED